jgi:hypothetical protein
VYTDSENWRICSAYAPKVAYEGKKPVWKSREDAQCNTGEIRIGGWNVGADLETYVKE